MGPSHGGKQSETLAMVPAIVARGGKWFSSIGSKGNAGTKVISVNGSVSRPCPVEVPPRHHPRGYYHNRRRRDCGQEAEGGHPGRSVRGVLPAQSIKIP